MTYFYTNDLSSLKERGILINCTTLKKDRPTILVIEDQASNIAVIAGFLAKRYNGMYDIATDAIKALRLYKQNRYDIIISDVGLPEISGLTLMRQIKKAAKQYTPIIAVTGYGDMERENCEAAGAEMVITKPYQFDKLEDAIFRCMELIVEKREEYHGARNQ